MNIFKRIVRRVFIEPLEIRQLKREVIDLKRQIEVSDKMIKINCEFGIKMYQKHHNGHAMWTRKNQHLKNKNEALRTFYLGIHDFAVNVFGNTTDVDIVRRMKASYKACRSISIETLETANLSNINSTRRPLIAQTEAEKQSNSSRQRWAEGLILQLPNTHNGRNSWLLNYGVGEQAFELRKAHDNLIWSEEHQAFIYNQQVGEPQ
jgi:hypothetical protein